MLRTARTVPLLPPPRRQQQEMPDAADQLAKLIANDRASPRECGDPQGPSREQARGPPLPGWTAGASDGRARNVQLTRWNHATGHQGTAAIWHPLPRWPLLKAPPAAGPATILRLRSTTTTHAQPISPPYSHTMAAATTAPRKPRYNWLLPLLLLVAVCAQ